MTPEQYRQRIGGIESWANIEAAKYRPAIDADPKPGCGEPGHIYGAVAAMAYQARYAEELAHVELTMRTISECVEADFYDVDRPHITDRTILEVLKRFDDRWKAEDADAQAHRSRPEPGAAH